MMSCGEWLVVVPGLRVIPTHPRHPTVAVVFQLSRRKYHRALKEVAPTRQRASGEVQTLDREVSVE